MCGVEVITVAVTMEPRNIWAVLKLPDPFSGSGPQVTLPKGLCVQSDPGVGGSRDSLQADYFGLKSLPYKEQSVGQSEEQSCSLQRC